ncbi:MAG: sigma-70 family RNA polymerase sigma factor [Propionibacteriaceae bacterium]|nr:sigma-70 family RNA polymerase sigma factor [Propionibacteriaceae bacterium]
MQIPELALPHVHLLPGEDFELARTIEAGVYAQYLLQTQPERPLLAEMVRAGLAASERLSWVGIRMALKLAQRAAYFSGLPAEELFQDGCAAVGEAIRRFDHTREVRFTTFVHEYLIRVMSDGEQHRVGHPQVSRADRRAARQESQSPAARRGRIRLVSLDDAAHVEVASADGPPETAVGTDFLALLQPRHQKVLRLRYGYLGQPRTLAEAARIMNASPSTVSRWEREAVEAARLLLAGDRTTTAAAYREEAAAAG